LLGDPRYVCLSNSFNALHIVVVVVQGQAVESYWQSAAAICWVVSKFPGS
jgi:hypothetical protein